MKKGAGESEEAAADAEDENTAETEITVSEEKPAEQAEEKEASEETAEAKSEAPKKKRTTRRRTTKKEAKPEANSEETAADETANAEQVEPDDNESDDSDGKTIAAVVETDWISEPLPEDEDGSSEDGDDDYEATAQEEEEEKPKRKRAPRRRKTTGKTAAAKDSDEPESDDEAGTESAEADGSDPESETVSEPEKKTAKKRTTRAGRKSKTTAKKASAEAENNGTTELDSDSEEEDEDVESVGQEDALEEVPTPRRQRRHYKIQEVIKRRQVLLVQVVKEERGTKGAALTTYLSLAGRYSVLMPNTARGGGISRKITNTADRKRLKTIAAELDVPEGMGVILRTAGASRTKSEITRDFEYLMRLWEQVRNLTLSSTAPSLVYEEGSLIKRSIRDLYDKDTNEILVSGDDGYAEAREFMGMLMPSHAKKVKQFKDPQAIFAKYNVEAQLDRMVSPQVTLKIGRLSGD